MLANNADEYLGLPSLAVKRLIRSAKRALLLQKLRRIVLEHRRRASATKLLCQVVMLKLDVAVQVLSRIFTVFVDVASSMVVGQVTLLIIPMLVPLDNGWKEGAFGSVWICGIIRLAQQELVSGPEIVMLQRHALVQSCCAKCRNWGKWVPD